MQIDPGSASNVQCLFTPVIPFPFPFSYRLAFISFSEAAPFKIRWEVNFVLILDPPSYLAQVQDPPEPCSGEIFELPKLAGPPLWGESETFRVDWWKNANDVPH